MIVRDLIKSLAKSSSDPNFIVTQEVDWLDTLNAEGDNLFPDVFIKNSTTLTWDSSSEIDETNYAIDLSGTTYTGIESIKDIYLIDTGGKSWSYDNFIYDNITKTINMAPSSYKAQSLSPCSSYPSIEINWLSRIGTLTFASDISLGTAELSLLKKICIKETMQTILLDHTKLDRYRTLTARSNEGVLLAIITNFNNEIREAKAKLTNNNSIRSF